MFALQGRDQSQTFTQAHVAAHAHRQASDTPAPRLALMLQVVKAGRI